MEFIIGTFIFLMFCSAIFGVAVKQEERHKHLVGIVDGIAEINDSSTSSWVARVEKVLAKVLPSQLGMSMLDKNLRQAGRPFKWDAHDVTVVRIVLGVVLLGISFLADTSLNGHIVMGLIFGGIGFMVPNFLISSYKSMRQAKIRKQLRSFQMMLALLAGTGIRFDQALHEAIQSTNGEFRKILDQMEQRVNFNSTVTEGFAWLSDEIGLPEINRLHVVIEQSSLNGTSLGESLQAMIQEYDDELENKIERLSQNVALKVTLTVLFLIVGPSVAFDGIIAGMNFMSSMSGF